MSWFSELTSKAEAMLVKLDQDTAQALQSTSQTLTKSDVPNESERIPSTKQEDQGQTSQYDETSQELRDANEADVSHSDEAQTELTDRIKSVVEGHELANYQPISNGNHGQRLKTRELIPVEDTETLVQDVQNVQVPNHTSHQPIGTPDQSRKFKLQTSKLRSSFQNREIITPNLSNGHTKSSKRDIPVIGLAADDIRASINRSLQEYSQLYSNDRLREDRPEQTSYSHFDDRPNLISHSCTNNNDQLGRLHSSPSFSIDVPDEQSTNITSQILKQSALSKKSPFNLHKVINRLASHRGHSQSLLGDKTKIRLRRAQMRVASYLRRMNYYFQAYPTMKYWMIGYLVILQILVVYVLFFYQSSSSSSDLINQVKQQEKLAELPKLSHSENFHPYSSD